MKAAAAKSGEKTAALFNVQDEPIKSPTSTADSTAASTATAVLQPVRSFVAKLIAFFAIITCTFGNLAAYGQNNLKRLLAYSTIAHAGYMMMPISAAVAMAGIDNIGAESAIAALAIYMAVYLFMNLAAFSVVALYRNAMRSEDVTDYAGLIRRSPLTVVCFAATLFSLIGLPPLAGFVGKFAIFASLVDGYQKVESVAGCIHSVASGFLVQATLWMQPATLSTF